MPPRPRLSLAVKGLTGPSLTVPTVSPIRSMLAPRSPSGNTPVAAMSPIRTPGQRMSPGFLGTPSPISAGGSAGQSVSVQARDLESLSPVKVEPASPPSLSSLSGVSFTGGNYRSTNLGNDYFINVRSMASPGKSTFDGHKIHISVSAQQFELAYSALGPLLFSSQSPISSFKLTDMTRAEAATPTSAAARVTLGAQFTLYLHSSSASGDYDAQQINAIRSFIGQCEEAMNKAGVQPGVVPTSDVQLGTYASYRNEHYDRTTATAEMADEKICQLLQPEKKTSE
jgi:hypothetical protein